MTPAERRLRAKHAALTRWATTVNRTAATATAREGFRAALEKKVDPNGELTPQERAKRAETLRKAHMAAIAQKSARVRRERKEQARKKGAA